MTLNTLLQGNKLEIWAWAATRAEVSAFKPDSATVGGRIAWKKPLQVKKNKYKKEKKAIKRGNA